MLTREVNKSSNGGGKIIITGLNTKGARTTQVNRTPYADSGPIIGCSGRHVSSTVIQDILSAAKGGSYQELDITSSTNGPDRDPRKSTLGNIYEKVLLYSIQQQNKQNEPSFEELGKKRKGPNDKSYLTQVPICWITDGIIK